MVQHSLLLQRRSVVYWLINYLTGNLQQHATIDGANFMFNETGIKNWDGLATQYMCNVLTDVYRRGQKFFTWTNIASYNLPLSYKASLDGTAEPSWTASEKTVFLLIEAPTEYSRVVDVLSQRDHNEPSQIVTSFAWVWRLQKFENVKSTQLSLIYGGREGIVAIWNTLDLKQLWNLQTTP